uniref:Uncharacterized protein n=1 Tax=Rhipicephalus appendiculatus TaxID=34631 RepID=A0A131YZF3_RHIAP
MPQPCRKETNDCACVTLVVSNDPRIPTAGTVKCPLRHNSSFCESAEDSLSVRKATREPTQPLTLLKRLQLMMIKCVRVLCNEWAFKTPTRCAIHVMPPGAILCLCHAMYTH